MLRLTKIRIVTDTASDITSLEAKQKNIDLVSLKVMFGEEDFVQETVEDMQEFYEKILGDSVFPMTSRPSPQDYLTIYQEALDKGQEVLVVSLSSRLSGTYESAVTAKNMLEANQANHIHVFDSRHAILSQRLMVDYAITLRDQGLTVAEIEDKLLDMRDRMVVYGAIDSLDFLRKGGRIPRSLAIIGKALRIKPLVVLRDGELKELDKKRGLKAAKKVMVQELDRFPLDPEFPVYFGYTYHEDNAREFMEEVLSNHLIPKTGFYPIGAIIGSHVGPNGIGMAFVRQK